MASCRARTSGRSSASPACRTWLRAGQSPLCPNRFRLMVRREVDGGGGWMVMERGSLVAVGSGPGPDGTRRPLEVGEDAEVVAGPDAVNRLVQDPLAAGDLQGRAVGAAADHDVVDPPAPLQRHLADPDEAVVGGEGVPGLARVARFPGVLVADAGAVQGLAAGPEPDAGCVRGGVEVA